MGLICAQIILFVGFQAYYLGRKDCLLPQPRLKGTLAVLAILLESRQLLTLQNSPATRYSALSVSHHLTAP